MGILPMGFTMMKKNVMSITQQSQRIRQRNFTSKPFWKASSNKTFLFFRRSIPLFPNMRS